MDEDVFKALGAIEARLDTLVATISQVAANQRSSDKATGARLDGLE